MASNFFKRVLFFAVLAFVASFGVVNAQSSADIELAKQMARQKGYSEAQIQAMISGAQNGGTVSKTAKVEQSGVIRVPVAAENEGVAVEEVSSSANNAADLLPPSTIYGHDIFRSKNLNFVPSYNMPTPENYKLAAGDELVIDIWGDVITNITATVTPEGNISIPDLGPVYIAGQSITQAEKTLKDYMGRIYSGIHQPQPTTFVKVSLGKIKSISINILGEVIKPGTYTLPSLSTIASAMYLAGGPTELGTVRNIKLYRNSKLVSTFDVYEFITKGNFNSNVRLEENDVIIVEPYKKLVTISGQVRRPMKYEIKDNETLSKLITYSGGFTSMAFTDKVHIDRNSAADNINDLARKGASRAAIDILKDEFNSYKLSDGDDVTVLAIDDQYKNRVNISGPVWRPGSYSISNRVSTLSQLIEAAGGLKEDAYKERGYITRLGETRNKEQVSFNVNNVILGKELINLCPDDSVYIFSNINLQPKQYVKIYGEVNNPSGMASPKNPKDEGFEYRKGMTIGDLILMAGGVTDAATLSRVEIARRMSKHGDNAEDAELKDTVALIMHYNLLKTPSYANVKLEPFDVVFVRKSAAYKTQQAITIQGEVLYPGTYVIEKNTVRLSDVVESSKGFTIDAYIKGAKLTRVLTTEEYERLVTAMQIAKRHKNDSTAFDKMEIGDRFDIAIDMQAALANPGSYSDVVLREGDIISIPKLNNTVKISGAVLYPNTVAYNSSYSWKDYISEAGGFSQNGLKKRTYMVHMNGHVGSRGGRNFKVEPGTEIVVPAKKENPNKGQTVATILGMASTTASMAVMVVTLIDRLK